MELKMINVGFGDCFIFFDGSNRVSFMVDFGSRGFKNSNFTDIDQLAEHIKSTYLDLNNRNYALITHFHSDHYSGFKYLSKHYSNIFDTLYVPYLCIEDSSCHKIVLLELAIYYYLLLNKGSYTWQVSDNILNHIKMVTKLAKNNNVICLSSWDNFSCSDREYEVIWPDKEMNFGNKLIEYIKQLNTLTNDLEDFNELKNKIIENMKKWYVHASVNKDSSINTDQINEIVRNQDQYLEELNKLRDKYSGLLADKDIYNSVRYYSTRLFSRSNNSASIVFQDKIATRSSICRDDEIAASADLGNMILMTGDIESNIIDQYLVDRFSSEKYYVLKAPHHGTQGHYSSNLPKSQNILISTGPRKGYSKICTQYMEHNDVNGTRACTNGHIYCEIISQLHMTCSRHQCQNNVFNMTI